MSVGPTTASTVFTLQLAGPISAAAKIPPFVVVPALTLAVSIWFLIFGVLGLGFIFDLIPAFICTAFVTALAIIATTLQILPLFGIIGIPNTFMTAIPGLFGSLSDISPKTVAIGFSALIFLGSLSFLKGKWGKERTVRGKVARGSAAMGVILVIFIFAAVSGLLTKDIPIQQQVAPFIPPLPPGGAPPAGPPPGAAAGGATAQAALANTTSGVTMISPMLRRQAAEGQGVPPVAIPSNLTAAAATTKPPAPKLPFWAAFPDFNTPLPPAKAPSTKLALSLFLPSVILFIAINIEHIVVARYYAQDNGYTISKSQEMFSLGVINLVNAFFGGVPVGGGDITRAAVLGFGGAKSPLSQIFTAGTVILTMNVASSSLRFLPQAALAAIVLVTVVDQQPPQNLITTFFKLSFADFGAFFLAMNLGIGAPSGINVLVGVGLGVIVMIFYTLFRLMFRRPKVIESADLERLYTPSGFEDLMMGADGIAPSTLVVRLEGDLTFLNAERTRKHVLDSAYVKNSGKAVSSADEPDRAWNLAIDKYVSSVRREHDARGQGGQGQPSFRPRLRMVVLDFGGTAFLDSSGLMSLELLKKQLRAWAGDTLEFRFVGLNKHLRRRFQRAKWEIVDPFGPRVEEVKGAEEDDSAKDFVFETLPQALRYMSQDVDMSGTFSQIVGAEKGFAM